MTYFKNLLFILPLVFFLNACSSDDNVEEDIKDDSTEEPETPTEYDPGNASDIEKDDEISPSDAKANQANSDSEDIDMTLDENMDGDHIYHSPWGTTTEFPVVLEYFFEDEDGIDYFILYPRNDQPNGRFGETTIYTKSEGDDDYQKLDDFDFKESGSPQMIEFSEGFKNPQALKIEVHSGANDFVSLAKIEFYKSSASMDEYLEIFEDKAATKLRSGITLEDIEEVDNEFIRNMAKAIHEDVYDDFRIGGFKSYPDPEKIAEENKTSTYGFYDNATGIYVKWGTEMVVFMDDFEGDISLKVINHEQGFEGKDYMLKPGINRFDVDTEGLAYLIYQDDDEHEVKANFATGKINGYFDIAKHDNSDWAELIDKASYSYFDVLGEKAMLSFTTDDLASNTEDIEELIGLYDDIVHLEQDLMGLYKYDRIPKTRAYFRTNSHDSDMHMYAAGFRTEYNVNTMPDLTNPETLRSSPWGPGHEQGHTHQTRPGLMWLGLTEVTTNIYAQYVQTEWGNDARLDEEDMGEFENRYEVGFTQALNKEAHGEIEDVFIKLIPFWQLQLYFAEVVGYDDFYKDLHEYIRENDDPDTPGKQQVNFVKIASEIAELDLSDFFKAWGFLSTGSFDLDDYGEGTIEVTQSMVDDAKSFTSQYPKPQHNLEYINERNIEVYQSKGSPSPGTASVSGKDISISGSNNVVVFEQERNGDVIYVAVDDSFSVSSYKDGDKFYAVGYDGERKEVTIN